MCGGGVGSDVLSIYGREIPIVRGINKALRKPTSQHAGAENIEIVHRVFKDYGERFDGLTSPDCYSGASIESNCTRAKSMILMSDSPSRGA